MTVIADDDILQTLPAEQREHLALVLDEYLVSLERSVPLPFDELVARHPDLAEPLRWYAESLRLLCLAGDHLGRPRSAEPQACAGSSEVTRLSLKVCSQILSVSVS